MGDHPASNDKGHLTSLFILIFPTRFPSYTQHTSVYIYIYIHFLEVLVIIHLTCIYKFVHIMSSDYNNYIYIYRIAKKTHITLRGFHIPPMLNSGFTAPYDMSSIKARSSTQVPRSPRVQRPSHVKEVPDAVPKL